MAFKPFRFDDDDAIYATLEPVVFAGGLGTPAMLLIPRDPEGKGIGTPDNEGLGSLDRNSLLPKPSTRLPPRSE